MHTEVHICAYILPVLLFYCAVFKAFYKFIIQFVHIIIIFFFISELLYKHHAAKSIKMRTIKK